MNYQCDKCAYEFGNDHINAFKIHYTNHISEDSKFNLKCIFDNCQYSSKNKSTYKSPLSI